MKSFLKKYLSLINFNFVIKIILSLVLFLSLSFTIYKPLYMAPTAKNVDIIIAALPEKVNESYGTDIRIKEIKINGNSIDFKTLNLNGNWMLDGGLLVAYQNDKISEITISNEYLSDVSIDFVKNIGSGYVNVKISTVEDKLNLYDTNEWDIVKWNYKSEKEFSFLYNKVPLFLILSISYILIQIFTLLIKDNINKKYLKEFSFILAILYWCLSFYTDIFAFNYDIKGLSITDIFSVNNLVIFKILFLIILIILQKFITNFIISVKNGEEKSSVILKHFIIYLGIMVVFLLLTWPGIWRWDEFEILKNMTNLNVNLWQNYLTSIYYIIGFMLIPSAAGFIFIQITVISFIVANIIALFETLIGGSKKAYLLYIPFLFLPVINQNLYPLRLSLYAYLELVYFVFLGQLYYRKKEITTMDIFKLTILTSILSAWRSEGIIFIITTPMILFIAFRKKISLSKLSIISACIITISIVFMIPQNLLNNNSGGNKYKVSMYTEFLDDLVKAEVKENENSDDLALLSKVINVDTYANSSSGESAFWSNGVNDNFSDEDFGMFKRSVLNLIIKYPDVFMKERIFTFLGTSGMKENIHNQVRNTLLIYPINEELSEAEVQNFKFFNEKIKASTPLASNIREKVVCFIEGRSIHDYNKATIIYPLFYNIIVPTLLISFLLIYSIIKRKILIIYASLVLLAQVCLIFLVAPGTYFMYYFPQYLCGYIFSTMTIIYNTTKIKYE